MSCTVPVAMLKSGKNSPLVVISMFVSLNCSAKSHELQLATHTCSGLLHDLNRNLVSKRPCG